MYISTNHERVSYQRERAYSDSRMGRPHASAPGSEPGRRCTVTAAGNINGLTPQERWDSEEDFIKKLISTSVPDHIFSRIKTKTNVHDVWMEITSVHQMRSKMITIDLDKQFQATKLGDTADPCIHFEKLEEMQEWLASMGKSFTDEEFTAILLRSLPQSYEQTINALCYASFPSLVSRVYLY